MPIRSFPLLLLLSSAAFLLIGCGGQQTGSAQLAVNWPTATTSGTQVATALGKMQSISLAIYRKKKSIATRILNRPVEGNTSMLQIDGVPVGSYTYLATAYAGTDGQGEVLGTASGTAQINQAQQARLTISSIADTHAALSITPESCVINIDDHFPFTARLVNPDGNPVIIPAKSLNWSVDDPKIATIDATTGISTGCHPGSTTIRLHEAGTDRAATATLTVKAKPASVFIYADKTTIAPGALVILRWQAYNADHVVRSIGFYADQLSGTIIVNPTTTTTYSITVAGPSGEAEGETIVVVQTNKLF